MDQQPLVRIDEQFNEWCFTVHTDSQRCVLQQDGLEDLPDLEEGGPGNPPTSKVDIHFAIRITRPQFKDPEDLLLGQQHECVLEQRTQLLE